MNLPSTFLGWAALFLMISLAVIAFVVLPMVISRQTDQEPNSSDLYYEEIRMPTLECSRCGMRAPPDHLRSLPLVDGGRVLLHRGGCPSERQGPRKRA